MLIHSKTLANWNNSRQKELVKTLSLSETIESDRVEFVGVVEENFGDHSCCERMGQG